MPSQRSQMRRVKTEKSHDCVTSQIIEIRYWCALHVGALWRMLKDIYFKKKKKKWRKNEQMNYWCALRVGALWRVLKDIYK